MHAMASAAVSGARCVARTCILPVFTFTLFDQSSVTHWFRRRAVESWAAKATREQTRHTLHSKCARYTREGPLGCGRISTHTNPVASGFGLVLSSSCLSLSPGFKGGASLKRRGQWMANCDPRICDPSISLLSASARRVAMLR